MVIAAKRPQAPPSQPRIGAAAVLVVNSNAVARERIAALLGAAHFEVTTCATAAEALAHCAAYPYAALVTDYMLDDTSGFALVRACHAAGIQPATIMTAGRGEVCAAVRAVREGIAEFLPGPPDGRLVQALRAALKTGER